MKRTPKRKAPGVDCEACGLQGGATVRVLVATDESTFRCLCVSCWCDFEAQTRKVHANGEYLAEVMR